MSFQRSGGSRFSRQGTRPGQSHGGRRFGANRFGCNSFSRGRHALKNLDVSRLINKAVPTVHAEFEPKHTFQDFALSDILKANIARKGYKKPTPIQDQAIIHLLQVRDIVGIADTGTGKTAAFLLLLINKVSVARHERVLIMAPTRELALQIFEEFGGFSFGLNIQAALIVGGLGMGSQIRTLKRNPHFIIATPGRLKDMAKRRLINLAQFHTVVLDEADRMVDMGFIHDIKFLLSLLPKIRHSAFFSATIPESIHELIQQFLRDPITVSVKSRDTSSNVDQNIIRISGKSKIEVLAEMLKDPEFSKVLVFGRTKHGVEKLSKMLAMKGFKVASIHGNKTQSSRQKALILFKKSIVQVLVATDVAARGLDIYGVSHVINYDMPATYEDYIHRIGRTGRADKIGKALTFVE